MKLGAEVCLGQGHIVLDGDLAPQKMGTAPPLNFRPMSVAAKRQDGLRGHFRTEVGLGPDDNVLAPSLQLPSQKGHSPSFRPMSIVDNARLSQQLLSS